MSDTSDFEDHNANCTAEEEKNKGPLMGFTESGERFVVPKTGDTVEMMCRVREIPTMISWFFLLLTIYVTLPRSLFGIPILDAVGLEPKRHYYTIVLCIFWRLMYNVVLGIVLRNQSNSHFITRFARWLQALPKSSVCRRILGGMLDQTIGAKDSLSKFPPEFNAWILNMYLVNVILPNDVMSFLCVTLVYFNSGTCGSLFLFQLGPDLSPLVCSAMNVAIQSLSVALIVSSVYGKFASHKVIGHFAWFWGDFFFKLDQTLKFDGIFELFPHPMYTVGYAWMYGFALASKSYEVCAVALLSHIFQILFLMYIENPHIDKVYGVEFVKKKSTHQENIFVVRNFDPFRSSDWLMLIILVLMTSIALVGGGIFGLPERLPKEFFFVAAAVSRLAGTFFIGYFLHMQSTTRFWTQHFLTSGQTREQAFEEWKRLCNCAMTLMNVAFVLCTWRYFSFPTFGNLRAYFWHYLSGLGVAVMLCGISVWSSNETYDILGDFGWYYGDHFMSRRQQKQMSEPNAPTRRNSNDRRDSTDFKELGQDYVLKGIYRYVNHPDFVLGKLWLYGFALLCWSDDVAGIAIFTHICTYLLLVLVEEPHMKRVYKNRLRKDSSALAKVLKEKVEKNKSAIKRVMSEKLLTTTAMKIQVKTLINPSGNVR